MGFSFSTRSSKRFEQIISSKIVQKFSEGKMFHFQLRSFGSSLRMVISNEKCQKIRTVNCEFQIHREDHSR